MCTAPTTSFRSGKAEVAWRRAETVLLRAGVKAGERVIVSRISGAVSGMKLRLPGSDDKQTVVGKR